MQTGLETIYRSPSCENSAIATLAAHLRCLRTLGISAATSRHTTTISPNGVFAFSSLNLAGLNDSNPTYCLCLTVVLDRGDSSRRDRPGVSTPIVPALLCQESVRLPAKERPEASNQSKEQ